jgi:hypothetical protein
MGMFDYLDIDEKFIPTLPELEDRGYKCSSFQTKDLDNALINYYIDCNGQLSYDDVEYDVIDNPNKDKRGWNPPFFLEERTRTRLISNYTGIINAVEFFNDSKEDSDNIWLKLEYTFVEGKIYKPVTVKDLIITSNKTAKENRIKWELIHEKRKRDPLFQISRYVSDVLSKIISKLTKFRSYVSAYDVPEVYEHKKETK